MMDHRRWMVIVSCLFSNILVSSSSNCGNGFNRIRLSSDVDNGLIVDPLNDKNYKANTYCSWYIEGNSSMMYIHLKINWYDIECLWDGLHIFQGDSIRDDALAVFSGNILFDNLPDVPDPIPFITNSGSSDGSGEHGEEEGVYDPPRDITIRTSGSGVLIYFQSDAGKEGRGFSISYWINNCIDNCSNNGICDEDEGLCHCYPSWTGGYCQFLSCPNECSHNGYCDNERKQCVCNDGYTGSDCSILESESHWSILNTPPTLDDSVVGRTDHTSVLWEDWIWVYGGYMFTDDEEVTESGSGQNEIFVDFIRYHVTNGHWEEVIISSIMRPQPRYAHTAVVYKDIMYVYGGALIETEDTTNEFWMFDFSTLIWTQIHPQNRTNITHGNESNTVLDPLLPVGVKEHTAHVINDTMLILFGYSTFRHLISYVQQYNFISNTWSIIPQYGDLPNSRMGHTSVYIPSLDSIYVYGGFHKSTAHKTLHLYTPSTNEWRKLDDSDVSLGFHSTVGIGWTLLSFGGSNGDNDCFSDQLLVYNILCNEWSTYQFPGLPQDTSRFGHTSLLTNNNNMLIYGGFHGVMFHELLLFEIVNCSMYIDEEECVNDTFCGWIESVALCTRLDLSLNISDLVLECDFDPCSIHYTCTNCNSSLYDCVWSNDHCIQPNDTTFYNTCDSHEMMCSQFTDCIGCEVQNDCTWNNSRCVNGNNVTPMSCDLQSCSQHITCGDCTNKKGCFWCQSLNKCIDGDVYPYSFLYGQCFVWSNDNATCPAEDCSGYHACSQCQMVPGCGWCRDPSDTGLGLCSEGGFLSSTDELSCVDSHWFFDTCPLCNCNGHSSCVNKSICIQCEDKTQGENCQQCIDGYYGNPVNGRNCSECDCNGYNPTCDNTNGTCTCLDIGVSGDRCTTCDTLSLYDGDAENLCHYEMSIGFIYTFGVTEAHQQQTFFSAVPKGGTKLNVKFDLSQNPLNAEIFVQFMIGKRSENYLLLVNLTDPISLSGGRSVSKTFESFSSSHNSSDIFSFARGSLRESDNFTILYEEASARDYSKHLWNGDVGLIIYVYNLSPPLQYKITIDQTDLFFLVYFFVTFIICFTLLLTLFLVGWYIKRKIEVRAMIRAQRVELQRRVRRPFAKIKVVIEKKPDLKAKQNASYVAVETCKDTKAAVLTLLIRLPGDRETGHPSINRTGVCFGSTLVRMNQSKKQKKKSTEPNTQEEHAT